MSQVFFWIVAAATILNNVQSFDLVIAHTNDVHARISQCENKGGYSGCTDPASEFNAADHHNWFSGCHGGAARRLTEITKLRADNDNVLFVDAGDEFQGTMWFTEFKGNATAHVVNALDYDAIALGNHEFDDGENVLAVYLDKLNPSIAVLAANLQVPEGAAINGKFASHTIKTFPGGEKVGIIGYITAETQQLSKPSRSTNFTNVIEAIKREVEILKQADVKMIVALGHVGWEKDLEIAAAIPEVDVVVGGHTNTFCYTGNPLDQSPYAYPTESSCDYPTLVQGVDGQQVCVVQNDGYGTWLGNLEVKFDAEGKVTSCGGQPIFLSGETVVQEPTLLSWIVQEWGVVMSSYTRVIGYNYVEATGDREIVREAESALGNLMTDAIIRINAVDQDDQTLIAPTLAMLNGGGVRASLPGGVVTIGNVRDIFPFDNLITIAAGVPGSGILQTLEHGVSGVEEREGRFTHWSGLRFTFDRTRPVGNRVVNVEVICVNSNQCSNQGQFVPLDLNATYDVLSADYLLEGGDGFGEYITDYRDDGGDRMVDYQFLVDYFQKFGPILPVLDGRIKEVVSSDNPLGCSDYSPLCSSRASNCQKDGTSFMDDAKTVSIKCYETCSCPLNKSNSCPTSEGDSVHDYVVIILSVVTALCVGFILYTNYCGNNGKRGPEMGKMKDPGEDL